VLLSSSSAPLRRLCVVLLALDSMVDAARSTGHRVTPPMSRCDQPRWLRRWWPDPMALGQGAREHPVTRRCTDGGSRDLHVRSGGARRSALAGRRRTREEAARLEAKEARPGTASPVQALAVGDLSRGAPTQLEPQGGDALARSAPSLR